MRRVHEVVAGLDVALARVVLHETTDRPPLGVEDRQAGADLVGKAVEVELCPELAVVTPLGLLQLVQVRGESLLGLPRGPVDALELLALLVTTPVGARDAHELEVAEPAGRGHVRAPAQVDERVSVPVRAHERPAGIDLVGARPHGPDDLLLERLIGEDLETFFQVVLMAHEGLVLLHYGPHLCFHPFQVVVAEVRAVGKLEVVVEAVLDHRADGVLGAGPKPTDGLRHHVGGGMTEHLAPGVGVGGDDRSLGAVCELGAEVYFMTVHHGGDSRLGQP